MKKLMMTLAAALSATALMAEVTSQNVVGYQTVTVAAGYSAIAPTFITIGGTASITADDIKGNFTELDSLQIFDDVGNVAKEIVWLVAGSYAVTTGWYDAIDFVTPAGGTVFAAGTSFWLNSQAGGTVTLAGEVNSSHVQVNAGAGYTPTGNAMPVGTTVDALQFTGLTELDSIQIFDGVGNVAKEIVWLVAGSYAVTTGWYDAVDFVTPAGSTALAAGQGFWINAQGNSVTMTVPSPL